MLRDARKILDLTIKGVATATGLSKPTVINVERGFGRYASAEAIRRYLIEQYKARCPLDPQERDNAFKMLMGLGTFDPNDGGGTGKRGLSKKPSKTPKQGDSTCPQDNTSTPAAARSAIETNMDGRLCTSEERPKTGSAECIKHHSLAASTESNFGSTLQESGIAFETPKTRQTSLISKTLSGKEVSIKTPSFGVNFTSQTAPIWSKSELSDIGYAARVRSNLTDGLPNVRALRRKLCNDIRDQAPTWLGKSTRGNSKSDGAIMARLRRESRVNLRIRKSDEALADRKTKVAMYALRFAAQIEKHSHSKGGYQGRAWMDCRATLWGLWDTPEFRAGVIEIYGKEISFQTFEKMFARVCGGVSAMERAAKNYVQQTIGADVEYAGQYVQMDGTEFPVDVARAWGVARSDGKVDYPAAFITDVASLRTWLHCEGTTSEVYLWNPVILKFLSETNFAPEFFMSDQGGRSLNSINIQKAGEHLTLDPAIRLLLAIGTRPLIHTPGNPRAKGAIEAGGCKAAKSTAKRLLVRRFTSALFSEIKKIPASYRKLDTEGEWREILRETEQMLNARIIKRVGDGTHTRENVWMQEEYVARRHERALAPDWQEKWRDVVAQGFAMQVRGENKLYWKGARAELLTPLGRPIEDGSVAILFPGGLRAGDEALGDQLLRGVIVEPRQGQSLFHAIEAKKIGTSFLGFETDRNLVGKAPIAIPETEHERRKRMWVEAGQTVPPPLREGTSGSQIDQTDVKALFG